MGSSQTSFLTCLWLSDLRLPSISNAWSAICRIIGRGKSAITSDVRIYQRVRSQWNCATATIWLTGFPTYTHLLLYCLQPEETNSNNPDFNRNYSLRHSPKVFGGIRPLKREGRNATNRTTNLFMVAEWCRTKILLRERDASCHSYPSLKP